MNEVIPRNEVRRHQIGFIESPFFAKVKVERALNDPSSMRGLMELIRQNGISLDDSQLEYHKRRVIEKIDRGEWFLITDKPFKPLSNIELEKHYGFRFTVLSRRSPRIANAKMCLSSGPGRWVTQNVKAHVATNALSFAANWLASRGDEGRIFLADGKDYANTFRTIIQEWQPLAYEEEHLKERSVYREFGELREIRQQFVEGDDHWQISGSSWHWRPATADIVYELEGD